ncbi:MAG: hypothetical protein AAGE05_14515 [Pseudomonadota bacterium]
MTAKAITGPHIAFRNVASLFGDSGKRSAKKRRLHRLQKNRAQAEPVEASLRSECPTLRQ